MWDCWLLAVASQPGIVCVILIWTLCCVLVLCVNVINPTGWVAFKGVLVLLGSVVALLFAPVGPSISVIPLPASLQNFHFGVAYSFKM